MSSFNELKGGEIIKAGNNYYKVSIKMKTSGQGNSRYEKASLKKLKYEELISNKIIKIDKTKKIKINGVETDIILPEGMNEDDFPSEITSLKKKSTEEKK